MQGTTALRAGAQAGMAGPAGMAGMAGPAMPLSPAAIMWGGAHTAMSSAQQSLGWRGGMDEKSSTRKDTSLTVNLLKLFWIDLRNWKAKGFLKSMKRTCRRPHFQHCQNKKWLVFHRSNRLKIKKGRGKNSFKTNVRKQMINFLGVTSRTEHTTARCTT